MLELENRLQVIFPQFNRIWIQYSNYRGYRYCITLFPHDYGRYRMLFGQTNEFSESFIIDLINQHLEKSI
jgi:hypothetical protein